MAGNVNERDYSQAICPKYAYEGISSEDLLDGYNKWASTYEQDVGKTEYGAPNAAATKICELFPPDSRAGIHILDIGAGTGLLGDMLKEDGFSRLDALDPSKIMLAEAERKGIYDNYFIEYITERPLAIEKDTYDVVVGTGMFGYNLVPYTAIHEMIRLTKPGGFVILSFRKDAIDFKEYENLEPTMKTLEKEGKWKQICRTVYPKYVTNLEGLLYAFQVL